MRKSGIAPGAAFAAFLLLSHSQAIAKAEFEADVHRELGRVGTKLTRPSGFIVSQLTPWAILSATAPSPGPTCSGTQYYLSAAGNDAMVGQTTGTAWQTIGHMNSGSSYSGGGLGPGQCLNLRGGDNFSGCAVFSTASNIASSSSGNPIIVRSYGTGQATITSTSGCSITGISNDKVGAVMIDGGDAALTGFRLTNIKVRNGASTPNAVVLQSSGGNTSTNIRVDSLDITGFSTPNNNNYFGAHIVVLGSPNHPGGCGNLSALTIENNTLYGASRTAHDSIGVFINGLCGSVTDVDIRGNTLSNFGSVTNSTVGAIGIDGQSDITLASNIRVSHNLIFNNGANVTSCGGPSGIEAANAQFIVFEYNEVYGEQPTSITQMQDHGGTACDFDGMDFDGSVQNSIMRGNYTHDNQSAGILMFGAAGGSGAQWGPNDIYANISQDDYQGWKDDYWASVVFGGKDTGNIMRFYNNTIVKTSTTGPAVSWVDGNAPATGSKFYNNIIYVQSGEVLSKCNGTDPRSVTDFKGNLYYTGGGAFTMGNNCSSAPANLAAWKAGVHGSDTGALFVDPDFVGPVPEPGPCSWTPFAQTGPQPCPAGYRLSGGSPAIGIGTSPGSPLPTRDFYGNSLPGGGGWNAGADGAN